MSSYKNLAEAAKAVAASQFILEGYKALDKHGFFFSKCTNLKGYKRKPPKFAPNADELISNKGNQYYTKSQLKALQFLGGLSVGDKIKKAHFEKLKSGYNKWDDTYGVIDYGDNSIGSPACNLFVGESIYWMYESSSKCMNTESKFYSAREYWNNNPKFREITHSDAKEGDIVAMSSGSHVEIITKTMRNRTLLKDGFCSIGAGRNTNSENGKEKCDDFFNLIYAPRELNRDSNKYFRIK